MPTGKPLQAAHEAFCEPSLRSEKESLEIQLKRANFLIVTYSIFLAGWLAGWRCCG